MTRRAAAGALALVALALAGCDRNGAAGIAFHTAWDMLGGEPDAEALRPSAHFAEAGIAFDYPALLRRRETVGDYGARSWSLEHGMFELELDARRDALRSAQVLGALGELLAGGRRLDAEGPLPGRRAMLCGRTLTATRLRLKIGGDWSEKEGFDLPAPPGQARILTFDDEPVRGQPSAVARATWERVLGSLRCDPSFSWPDPVRPDQLGPDTVRPSTTRPDANG